MGLNGSVTPASPLWGPHPHTCSLHSAPLPALRKQGGGICWGQQPEPGPDCSGVLPGGGALRGLCAWKPASTGLGSPLLGLRVGRSWPLPPQMRRRRTLGPLPPLTPTPK